MSIREDFEAWAASRGHNLNTIDGEYLYSAVRNAFDGYQAATSRQEAKIKALRDSLTWALSNISEEHYGWPSEEDADAHNAAIAAAKETS